MKLHPATLWLTVLLGSPAWAATPAPVTHATPAKPAAAKPAAAKPVPAATQPRPAPAPSLAPVVEALAGLKVQLLAVSAEVESLKAETAAIREQTLKLADALIPKPEPKVLPPEIEARLAKVSSDLAASQKRVTDLQQLLDGGMDAETLAPSLEAAQRQIAELEGELASAKADAESWEPPPVIVAPPAVVVAPPPVAPPAPSALEFSANIEPRFTFADVRGASDAGRYAGSGFRVRRAVLTGSVKFASNYELRIRFETARSASVVDGNAAPQQLLKPILDDAYVNAKVSGEALMVQVGQFRVPYGLEQLTGDPQLMFGDRSVLVDGFKLGDLAAAGLALGRDMGVMLHGREADGRVYWQAGAWNGDGQNTFPSTDPAGYLYAGRVSVEPLGKMDFDQADLKHGPTRVGFALSGALNRHPRYDEAGAGGGAKLDDRLGIEARASSAGFAIAADGMYGVTLQPDAKAAMGYGLSASASYAASKIHLVPAARLAVLDRVASDDDVLMTVDVGVSWLMPDLLTPAAGDDLGHKGKVLLDWQVVNSTAVGLVEQIVFLEMNVSR